MIAFLLKAQPRKYELPNLDKCSMAEDRYWFARVQSLPVKMEESGKVQLYFGCKYRMCLHFLENALPVR